MQNLACSEAQRGEAKQSKAANSWILQNPIKSSLFANYLSVGFQNLKKEHLSTFGEFPGDFSTILRLESGGRPPTGEESGGPLHTGEWRPSTQPRRRPTAT